MEFFERDLSPHVLREFLQSTTPKRKSKFSPRIAKLRSMFSPSENSHEMTNYNTPKSSLSRRMGKDKQPSRTKSPRTIINRTANTSKNTNCKTNFTITHSYRSQSPLIPKDSNIIYSTKTRELKEHDDQQASQVRITEAPRIVITQPDLEFNESSEILSKLIVTNSAASREETIDIKTTPKESSKNVEPGEPFTDKVQSRKLHESKDNIVLTGGKQLETNDSETNTLPSHPLPNEMIKPLIVITNPDKESNENSEILTDLIVSKLVASSEETTVTKTSSNGNSKNTHPIEVILNKSVQGTFIDKDKSGELQQNGQTNDIGITAGNQSDMDENDSETKALQSHPLPNEMIKPLIVITTPDKEFTENSEILGEQTVFNSVSSKTKVISEGNLKNAKRIDVMLNKSVPEKFIEEHKSSELQQNNEIEDIVIITAEAHIGKNESETKTEPLENSYFRNIPSGPTIDLRYKDSVEIIQEQIMKNLVTSAGQTPEKKNCLKENFEKTKMGEMLIDVTVMEEGKLQNAKNIELISEKSKFAPPFHGTEIFEMDAENIMNAELNKMAIIKGTDYWNYIQDLEQYEDGEALVDTTTKSDLVVNEEKSTISSPMEAETGFWNFIQDRKKYGDETMKDGEALVDAATDPYLLASEEESTIPPPIRPVEAEHLMNYELNNRETGFWNFIQDREQYGDERTTDGVALVDAATDPYVVASEEKSTIPRPIPQMEAKNVMNYQHNNMGIIREKGFLNFIQDREQYGDETTKVGEILAEPHLVDNEEKTKIRPPFPETGTIGMEAANIMIDQNKEMATIKGSGYWNFVHDMEECVNKTTIKGDEVLLETTQEFGLQKEVDETQMKIRFNHEDHTIQTHDRKAEEEEDELISEDVILAELLEKVRMPQQKKCVITEVEIGRNTADLALLPRIKLEKETVDSNKAYLNCCKFKKNTEQENLTKSNESEININPYCCSPIKKEESDQANYKKATKSQEGKQKKKSSSSVLRFFQAIPEFITYPFLNKTHREE